MIKESTHVQVNEIYGKELATMEDVCQYEAAVEVLRFIISTYQCAAGEIDGNMVERKVGKPDKIKFE